MKSKFQQYTDTLWLNFGDAILVWLEHFFYYTLSEFPKVRLEASVENNVEYYPNLLIDNGNSLIQSGTNKQEILSYLQNCNINTNIKSELKNFIYVCEKEVSIWLNIRWWNIDFNVWFIGEMLTKKELIEMFTQHDIHVSNFSAHNYFASINFSLTSILAYKIYEIFPLDEISSYKNKFPLLQYFKKFGQNFYLLHKIAASWEQVKKGYISVYSYDIYLDKEQSNAFQKLWFTSKKLEKFYWKKIVGFASNGGSHLEIYFDIYRSWN